MNSPLVSLIIATLKAIYQIGEIIYYFRIINLINLLTRQMYMIFLAVNTKQYFAVSISLYVVYLKVGVISVHHRFGWIGTYFSVENKIRSPRNGRSQCAFFLELVSVFKICVWLVNYWMILLKIWLQVTQLLVIKLLINNL